MDQMERIEYMKRHLNDLKELKAELDRIIEQQNEPEKKELTKNQISEIVNDPWED